MSRQKIKQFMRKISDDDDEPLNFVKNGIRKVKKQNKDEQEYKLKRDKEYEQEHKLKRDKEDEQIEQKERINVNKIQIENVDCNDKQEIIHENEHELCNETKHEISNDTETEIDILKNVSEKQEKIKREVEFEDENTTELDTDNPFVDINKQVFIKYLKSNGISYTEDIVNSMYTIMSEIVYSIFFKVLSKKKDNSVNITLSDITNIISNYIEDEELPEDVFIPMKMFSYGINNICNDCKCTIKRDALIHLHIFTEFLVNKIISNSTLIAKNAKRNRISGKDIILSHKLSLL